MFSFTAAAQHGHAEKYSLERGGFPLSLKGHSSSSRPGSDLTIRDERLSVIKRHLDFNTSQMSNPHEPLVRGQRTKRRVEAAMHVYAPPPPPPYMVSGGPARDHLKHRPYTARNNKATVFLGPLYRTGPPHANS